MSKLFTPIQIRDLKIKNRIFVSPMCQYSAEDGVANNWHLVHLGTRAVGGAGLVMAEATAIRPDGRISPNDTGIWNEKQVEAFKPITDFIHTQNSVSAIQLAHAGRKASTPAPWNRERPFTSSWKTVAPSSIPFSKNSEIPSELTLSEISELVEQFAEAAHRSIKAGFQVIELHMAHGYLMNEFLSPVSNVRMDLYGGTFENRTRFPLEVIKAVRQGIPSNTPLLARISAVDWMPNGWQIEDSIELSKLMKKNGVDLVDCSSGGIDLNAKIEVKPGYQVDFAHQIKQKAQILTGAVGLITEPKQAEEILQREQADVIFLARELLRNPYWPLTAAQELNASIHWPKQYERAKK
jgi:2,4-dienoyl-CoA reductase-like NADH-dependent reductase (Old Yellow Enzyme family)